MQIDAYYGRSSIIARAETHSHLAPDARVIRAPNFLHESCHQRGDSCFSSQASIATLTRVRRKASGGRRWQRPWQFHIITAASISDGEASCLR
jgi:hypothetical protein